MSAASRRQQGLWSSGPVIGLVIASGPPPAEALHLRPMEVELLETLWTMHIPLRFMTQSPERVISEVFEKPYPEFCDYIIRHRLAVIHSG
jgi:hypothetical protein